MTDENGNVLVTAYALKRPDGQWSLMLINKDHDHNHPVTVAFTSDDPNSSQHFERKIDQITFGAAQYEWHNGASGGQANPDGPAARSTIEGSAGTVYDLQKASIVVLRGRLSL